MPERPKRYKPVTGNAPKYTPPGMKRPSAHARGYDSRWQKSRLSYLADHPLCVPCGERGVTASATVVDHHIPHRGNQELFWDASNWVAMCATCHNSATAKYDGGGGHPVRPKPQRS